MTLVRARGQLSIERISFSLSSSSQNLKLSIKDSRKSSERSYSVICNIIVCWQHFFSHPAITDIKPRTRGCPQQRELTVLSCVSYFQLSSQCFVWWWNTASHAWYITSQKEKKRSYKRWDERALEKYSWLMRNITQQLCLEKSWRAMNHSFNVILSLHMGKNWCCFD